MCSSKTSAPLGTTHALSLGKSLQQSAKVSNYSKAVLNWLQVFNQCWWRCAVDGAEISMVTLVWQIGKGQQWRVLLLSHKLWRTDETLITHSCDEALFKCVCVCCCVRVYMCMYMRVFSKSVCSRGNSHDPQQIEVFMIILWGTVVEHLLYYCPLTSLSACLTSYDDYCPLK